MGLKYNGIYLQLLVHYVNDRTTLHGYESFVVKFIQANTHLNKK